MKRWNLAILSCSLCVLCAAPSWAHDSGRPEVRNPGHARHLERVFKASLLWDAATQRPFSGHDLNNHGEVCGLVQIERPYVFGPSAQAAIWSHGQVTLLPDTDFSLSSSADALNDVGVEIGRDDEAAVGWAAIWHDGVLSTLGSIEGERNYSASDINNREQIVVVDYYGRVLVLGGDGASEEQLDAAPDGYGPSPANINEVGHVAGSDHVGDPAHSRAVLWRDGTVELLGTPSGMTDSEATGLNDFDRVVGVASNRETGVERAFSWNRGRLKVLPLLHRSDAEEWSEAHAINDWGQIVGNEGSPGGTPHAVLWELGRVFDLNALVRPTDHLGPHVTLTSASRINQRGQILVSAHDDRTVDTELTYLLTPVLEWR
jgi:uncharacterized membrane protein